MYELKDDKKKGTDFGNNHARNLIRQLKMYQYILRKNELYKVNRFDCI